MNDFVLSSGTFGVVISLIAYGFGVLLKSRFKKDIFNPLLISLIVVISVLVCTGVDYESYNSSARYLSFLLTPATVSLAIPLYMQIQKLKENITAILCSVLTGCVTSMVSVLLLCRLFGMDHEVYVTLLPKSITTAIGMGVSRELGGYVTISIAVILVTGILGNMSAVVVCRLFRITDPVAKGLAIGSSAHAIGTSKAMQMGELEGAMSSLAIVISGLFTVIGAAIFAHLY